MNQLTAVSLFAGVGGFDLALERNGVTVTAAVEIDKAARSVLGRQFPQTILFNDVCEVTGEQLISTGFVPERGIITGGFPCQDVSVAGKRAGLDGARSGLFWEICRLLDETKAKYFILENVPGLLTSNNGRDMGTVVGALVDRGYGIAYRVLDAARFGLPQRRKRIFIVGCLGDDGRTPQQILALSESVRGDSSSSNQTQQATTGTSTKSFGSNSQWQSFVDTTGPLTVGDHVGGAGTFNGQDAYTGQLVIRAIGFNWQNGGGYGNANPGLGITEEGVGPLSTSQVPAVASAQVRRLTPLECERLQGFPDNWTQGQADSHRYRQMGNAVAVPVVEWITARLVAAHTNAPTIESEGVA